MRIALDFDGVVCDALTECAAATLVGGASTGAIPRLVEAVDSITPAYLARFASVRSFSRTFLDFMVTNVVASPLTTRAAFVATRDRAYPSLVQQVQRAQQARDHWRNTEADAWLDLHTLYPGIQEFLLQEAGHIAIVSNKDGEAIDAILRHRGLRHTVTSIIGNCSDKPTAVADLGPAATFIDDNVDNVLAVRAIPGVSSLWATWGYHNPEDAHRATRAALTPLTLHDLPGLTQAA